MAQDKSDQYVEYIKIGAYGVLFYFGYKALMQIMETLGLSKTAAETNVDTAQADTSGNGTTIQENPFIAFNPKYSAAIVGAYNKKYAPQVFNGTKNLGGISQAGFLDLAKRIDDSKGLFNDDEDTLYDVFRSISTQWQLSFLAAIFSAYYKKDLFLYLKSFLNANELNSLLSMIKNYPQYIK